MVASLRRPTSTFRSFGTSTGSARILVEGDRDAGEPQRAEQSTEHRARVLLGPVGQLVLTVGSGFHLLDRLELCPALDIRALEPVDDALVVLHHIALLQVELWL